MVYHSRQNALVALLVFVFVGILCSSTVFAETVLVVRSLMNTGIMKQKWKDGLIVGKATWQFGRTVEYGCLNYYEGGWKYENPKAGKWIGPLADGYQNW